MLGADLRLWAQPGRLMLVTEYMAGGDLFTALAKDRSEPRKFSWSRWGLCTHLHFQINRL